MAKNDEPPSDYDVGNAKPPKEHQFKPGQSGNPNGRPKGSKNVHHLLSKILGEKITITDGGKKMVVEKLEGAIRVLVNESFKGKPQSLKLLMDLVNQDHIDAGATVDVPVTDQDYRALMKDLAWIEQVRDAQRGSQTDDTA